jgi:ribose/xylose/arabinose/galactoside ABC-type transport system permease subunit
MSQASETVAGRTAARPQPARPLWQTVLLSEYLVLALTVLYVALMAPLVPELLTLATWSDILAALMPLLVIAIGQTFVLIVAGIDLSATSVLAMASVVGASLMTGDAGAAFAIANPIISIPVGIVAFLLVGAAVGAFNGACTSRFNMPPFIVTLTTMMFFSGAAIWFTSLYTTSGSSIGNLPRAFSLIGQGKIAIAGFDLPVSIFVAAAIGIAAHLVLGHTLFGRWLYAIGLNPRAAEVSGVPVRRAIFWAFVISGACAGLAAILYTGRLETGSPVLGQRILLDVVGAAVIGGVSLFGGKGKIIWTLYGALFLTVVDKGLQLLGLSLASMFAIKGGVILAAAIVDAQRQRLFLRG